VKPRLTSLLCCPNCQGELSCHPVEEREAEVLSGELRCSACGASYPIIRGIPRFVPGAISDPQRRTASAFGWEWQRFPELDAPAEDQFLDWIYPLTKEFFAGKTVLDAGCGQGRWAEQAALFGAADVIGADISEAVEAAQVKAERLPNLHIVQADIYHLPFARPFDFGFSIGVLHHLPDPEAGFHSVVKHLRPGGAMHAWVYGRENNGWLVHAGNPIREGLSSRLPKPVLYWLSFGVAAAMHPVLKLLYKPRDGKPATGSSSKSLLPYHGYLSWLAQFSLQHNHHVVFDHMVAPTAFYIRHQDFEAWFERAGLRNVRISWRNQNSWRGYGERY
jgi:SAM-dependent methyltransferase